MCQEKLLLPLQSGKYEWTIIQNCLELDNLASYVFQQLSKPTLTLIFNSLILIKVSNWDLRGWCKGA